MKRIQGVAAVLAAGLAFCLTACGTSGESVYSTRQIAEVILASQGDLPPFRVMTAEEASFAAYLDAFYLLGADALRDGAVFASEGAEAAEVAVLELSEGADPAPFEAALAEYAKQRASAFAGYFPSQSTMAANAAVAVNGRFVALIICADPAGARAAFLACFGGNPPPLPDPAAIPVLAPPAAPQTEPEPETRPSSEEYDHDAVLAAWESGDPGALSEKNRTVLDVSAAMIGEYITPDMPDYEKERLVHDWIAAWADYDEGVLRKERRAAFEPDNGEEQGAAPNPDNDNPYGLLIGKQAVCGGYTGTFQLFMDMLGIECVTVRGIYTENGRDHAWNMVRLADGEWYGVDVTWDDTGDEDVPVIYEYFNVTSASLRESGHEWDETETPEATSEKYERERSGGSA